MTTKGKNARRRLLMGNQAICEGAIAGGVKFYAGYPITPATEIAEYMSQRMPQVGGKYVQMEDEIGSIYAVTGASASGVRAMTASSGPGIALMQEGIGAAIAMEIPLVVAVMSRPGAGAGDATGSGQTDIMQARWGPNGDSPIIALSPSTVSEAFWVTVKAVDISERFRTPVIILSEGLLALLWEVIDLPDYSEVQVGDRPRPKGPPEDYKTYALTSPEDIPPMGDFGSGYRSIFHYVPNHPYGARNGQEALDFTLNHLHAKIMAHREEITITKATQTEDAEILLIAAGTQARSAETAVGQARDKGLKVGLLKLTTLWPFPYDRVQDAAKSARLVVIPEMNSGQIQGEVMKALRRHPAEIVGVNHLNSLPITPDEILDAINKEMS